MKQQCRKKIIEKSIKMQCWRKCKVDVKIEKLNWKKNRFARRVSNHDNLERTSALKELMELINRIGLFYKQL